METRVSSATKEVVISDSRPTVLIGERLNPTGKAKLAAALQAGDMQEVQAEALAQVQAGADVLDVNVGAPGVDSRAGLVTLETIRRVKTELGANMTFGGSNVSFGMPDRPLLNAAFMAVAIAAGITCPIVNVSQIRPAVLAIDLALGRDPRAARYIKAYRQRQGS